MWHNELQQLLSKDFIFFVMNDNNPFYVNPFIFSWKFKDPYAFG
jgi:hypothetical protein